MDKKKRGTLVDNITDYADADLFEEDNMYDDLHQEDEPYDVTDRTWMYEDDGSVLEDEDEITDADLWDEEPEERKPPREKSTATIPADREADMLMTVLLWVNNLRKRKSLTEKEVSYIGLMLIELSNFYFKKDQIEKAQPKVRDAMRKICKKITASGIMEKEEKKS